MNTKPVPGLAFAGWMTIIGSVVLLILSFILDSLLPYYNLAVSDYPNILSASWLFVLLVGIIALFASNFLKRVPDETNKKFWAWRAFYDFILALFIAPIFLLLPFVTKIGEMTGDMLSGVSNSFSDFSSLAMTPLDFFTSSIATALALGGIVILRWIFKTIPKDIIKISFFKTSDYKYIFIYGLPLVAFSALYEWGLKAMGVEIPAQFVFTETGGFGTFLILIAVVLFAPVFEELFFRGYLLPLFAIKGKWFALIFSSILFALIHFYPIAIPVFIAISIVLGLSYFKTKNLIVPIGIHMLNNLIASLEIIK